MRAIASQPLETESSSRAVPEDVSCVRILAEDSVRFLGDVDGSSYFVARSAEDPEFEACLIEIHPEQDVPSVAFQGREIWVITKSQQSKM